MSAANGNLALAVPADLVEQIAERAAELIAERHAPAEDGWIRGAAAIARYVDAPASRIYALAACNPPRLPIYRDGSALIARRSELDAWIVAGGGLRP